MPYITLQRCQNGNVSDPWDFTVANGQHGEGVYCFFAGDKAMKDYYCKNNENLHTFKIDSKYLADLSNKNMDYWEAKAFIYNNPRYKAFAFKHKGPGIPGSKEVLITDPSIIIMNEIKNIIQEELQNLNEELNKISMQQAVDRGMFGPVYHGTTEENREEIEKQGFKVFTGGEREGNIRHGYPGGKEYAGGAPPPIHHLGYGIYFTTSKTIAKKFNLDSGKGLKTYYLDIPRMETINFGSPRTMMDWWVRNGYDKELANQGEQGRIEATKKLTETLKKNFDGVWYKGRGVYKLLDGDQVVVFDPRRIYQVDQSMAGEMEIGSRVRRTEDRYDYTYSVDTNTGQSTRTLMEKPAVAKGTVGTITAKKPAEPMRKHWRDIGNTAPHWTGDSQWVYTVKWNKGGTELNTLDKHLEPVKKLVKKLEESIVMQTIREETINMLEARFAQPLKKTLASDEAYAILDSTAAHGSTWCAGGCAILAQALNMAYGYETWVVWNHDRGFADHFIARTPKGTFVDCDGEQLDILRNFKRKEYYNRPGEKLELRKYEKGMNAPDIVFDPEASRKLAEFMKKGLQEGVADKYGEKRFNIPDPVAGMNVKTNADIQKNEERPVAYVKKLLTDSRVPIYKNPKSLVNFDKDVRAIADPQGNLYVVQESGFFVHGDMAVALGFFNEDTDVYDNQDKFLLLQRIGTSQGFGLNDTSSDRIQGNETNLQQTVNMMKTAKKVNPQFEFYPEPFEWVNRNSVGIR